MRVAFVLDRYPSFYQTFVLSQMVALEAQGIPLAVLSLKAPPALTQAGHTALAAPVAYAPRRHRLDLYGLALARCLAFGPDQVATRGACLTGRRVVVANWLRGLALADAARALGVTHVHAHFAAGANVAAMAVAGQLGVPFSFTSHAVDLFVRPAWLCETLRAAAFHTTISHYNRRFVATRCGEALAEKTFVVRGGVDVPAFRVWQRVAHDPPCVLSVGRLIPKKGFGDLVAALALVHRQGLAFRAVIVGDGPLAAALHADIERLGLARHITLRGPVDLATMRTLYEDADVFALPCVVAADGDRDGIPASLMEAMAAGLPVVSTPVSGIPELISPEAGLLPPPHDPAALAEALVALLRDPPRRLAMGEAGRRIVAESFDVAGTAAELAALISGAEPTRQPPG